MPAQTSVGISGPSNRDLTEMWAGTSGGNKQVTEGWVGTSGGNKQFLTTVSIPPGTVLFDSTTEGPWSWNPGFSGNVVVELWGGEGGDQAMYVFDPIDGIYVPDGTNAGGEGGTSTKTIAVTLGSPLSGTIGLNGANGFNYGFPTPSNVPGDDGTDTTCTGHHTAHAGTGANIGPGTPGGQTGGSSGTTGGSFDGRVRITVA